MPAFFGDLNLDQVLGAMTKGRERYALEPFFCSPLGDVADLRYRHEACRDLERDDVREAVDRFAEGMESVRRRIALVEPAASSARAAGLAPGGNADLLRCRSLARRTA